MTMEGNQEFDPAYESFIANTRKGAREADLLSSHKYADWIILETREALNNGIQSPAEATSLLAKLDAVFERTKDIAIVDAVNELKSDIRERYPDLEY